MIARLAMSVLDNFVRAWSRRRLPATAGIRETVRRSPDTCGRAVGPAAAAAVVITSSVAQQIGLLLIAYPAALSTADLAVIDCRFSLH